MGVLRLDKFASPNGRSGDMRCTAKRLPLHMQENAASAKAKKFKVGFVRKL